MQSSGRINPTARREILANPDVIDAYQRRDGADSQQMRKRGESY